MQMQLDLGRRSAIKRSRAARSLTAPVFCVAAPVAPAQTSTNVPVQATLLPPSSGSKLPSTHLESSKRALEQLKESAVNRESLVEGEHRS
jgi:hypothetical protein